MYSVLLLFRQLRAAAVFVYVCVYINHFLCTYIARRCLFERCVYLSVLVPIHVSLLMSVVLFGIVLYCICTSNV